MKVWRFYLIPEKDSEYKRYDLYAVTNNKKYAKRFKSERNMDMFIERCSDEDKDEYIKFANEHRNNVLINSELITRDVDNNGYISTKKVDLLLTCYEKESCDTDNVVLDFMTEDIWHSAVSYRIYKNKITDSLRTLEYISNYKLYTLPFDNRLIDPKDDDYSAPDIWIDEVGVFVRTFGHTFK